MQIVVQKLKTKNFIKLILVEFELKKLDPNRTKL